MSPVLSLPPTPAPPSPLGHHRAGAELSVLSSSLPLAVLHTAVYKCQLYSLHSSPPSLSPMSPSLFPMSASLVPFIPG